MFIVLLKDIGVPITEIGVEVDVLLLIVTGSGCDSKAGAGEGRSWSVG